MESKIAVEMLAALAQTTRLEVFRALVAAGPEGLAAGEIAQRLDVPPPTLSFHLKDLATAGLATSVREGRSIRYAADFETMTSLMSFLTENCCGGRPELCPPAGCGPASSKPASSRTKLSQRVQSTRSSR